MYTPATRGINGETSQQTSNLTITKNGNTMTVVKESTCRTSTSWAANLLDRVDGSSRYILSQRKAYRQCDRDMIVLSYLRVIGPVDTGFQNHW